MSKHFLIAITLLTLTAVTRASEVPNDPHIVTSGSANIEAIPDIATLDIEVNTVAQSAVTAKKQADERVAQYLDFLQKNGVQRKDINALNLRTQPNYEYQNGKSTLKGYRAIRNVAVTVRELSKLNSLLDGALQAGLNDIRALTPGVAHPEQYQEQARQAAIASAMSQSKALAKSFNSTLGPIYSVRYHASDPQSVPMLRAMYADSRTSASNVQDTYENAVIQFHDQVDVVFRILPNP